MRESPALLYVIVPIVVIGYVGCCAGFFSGAAPFGSCVMQALSVTKGSVWGGGLHAVDTRAKMFVSLLASVATVALSAVERRWCFSACLWCMPLGCGGSASC